MPIHADVFRAPMRARELDLPAGVGAAHGIAHGRVGTGDARDEPPARLDDAVRAATAAYGEKAGRMLERFAALPEGTFVWTRLADDTYRLGRITGPWRYDDSGAARAVGIHHVRDAAWLERPFGDDIVPGAVAATFARGGRNVQRIHGDDVDAATAALWQPPPR